MASITILDEILISKIAAGEVIERPASIVKELMENSLDANASEIRVDVSKGGRQQIKITDNGHGMSKDDLLLAPIRHATSKIQSVDDLFAITTMGFRGEALASMAAVGHVEIVTRNATAPLGYKLVVKGGKVLRVEEHGSPPGTSVNVQNLFFNVPVRRDYMKDDQVELRHITQTVMRYALIFPEINFTLTHNGKSILHSPATTALNNLTFLLGKEVARHMLPVDHEGVTGFVSAPALTKKEKSHIYLYLNKRAIKSQVITNALLDAYHTLLMQHRFPVAVLNISIDPADVDVNIHPQKSEVKLKNEKEVYALVVQAIKSTLQTSDLTQEPAQHVLASITSKKPTSYQTPYQKGDYFQQGSQATLKPEPQQEQAFNIIGQAHKTYVIVEDKQGILLVDQHALQERLFYDALSKDQPNIQQQQLLSPKILDVTSAQLPLLTEHKEVLRSWGYQLEPFGPNSVKLYTVPLLFGVQIDPDTIHDIIDVLEEEKSYKLRDVLDKVTARMACRKAIKAGDLLTNTQMCSLVNEMRENPGMFTCPHGRPIALRFTVDDLEKLFKRKV